MVGEHQVQHELINAALDHANDRQGNLREAPKALGHFICKPLDDEVHLQGKNQHSGGHQHES